jgi:hypothetical protein
MKRCRAKSKERKKTSLHLLLVPNNQDDNIVSTKIANLVKLTSGNLVILTKDILVVLTNAIVR